MQLERIEGSSVVESAGFQDGVLRILFRSGNWKDFTGRAPADLEALLRAPSKGRWVHENLNGRPAPAPAAAPEPLDTFQDDECCSPRLSRALLTGKLKGLLVWTCPKCSVEWKPEPTPAGRHWTPRVWAGRL